MGKNASKNFVNQFKNTRRLAGLIGRRPLVGLAGRQAAVPHVGLAGLRVAAPLWGQAGRRPLVGPARHLKKLLPWERKNEKNPNRGDK